MNIAYFKNKKFVVEEFVDFNEVIDYHIRNQSQDLCYTGQNSLVKIYSSSLFF
jgi:hypothetical protein